MSFLDDMLGGKINKEAEILQGTDALDHAERKLAASNWIAGITDLNVEAVEAEYQANLAAEAKLLGKTAAYEQGETPKETIEKDYARDVKILSDYALAEMLAELRCSKAQNTAEMFAEAKEKAKKEISSSREKAEKALLELTPDHTMLDWQKAFDRFSKDAKPEEVKEKDLYKPEVPEKEADFSKPSEDKFKMPTKEEMVPEGNGREADKCKEVTKEAAKKEPHTEECNKANDKHVGPTEVCICDQKKIAEKVKDNPADDKGNLAMPEGKKSAGDKPVESVEESTLLPSPKEVGDKSDQAAEAASPEKGDKAKLDEAVNKEAHCGSCPGDPGVKVAEPISPLKREEVLPVEVKAEGEVCPVCSGPGENLGSMGSRDHFRCQGCGITFSHEKEASCEACASLHEITSQASHAETIKKVAEVSSPWKIIVDEKTGKEMIARIEQPKNEKISEEIKEEEIKK